MLLTNSKLVSKKEGRKEGWMDGNYFQSRINGISDLILKMGRNIPPIPLLKAAARSRILDRPLNQHSDRDRMR